MQKISGLKIAEKIISRLKSEKKPDKILAAVLVGENPASISFLKQKEKVAKELGIDFFIYNFPETIKTDDLREEVSKIASSEKIGGIIIQLPLPDYIDNHLIVDAIPAEKDVDALRRQNTNKVLPPAVEVVDEIIRTYNLQLKNLKAAVVGLGFLVGQPVSDWLKEKCREIYLLDEGDDLAILKQADLVISGVGKAHLFSSKNLKQKTMVIDFGYDMKNGKISGDFNPSSDKDITYTPTPGGTGPILVAKIFENFYRLNK